MSTKQQKLVALFHATISTLQSCLVKLVTRDYVEKVKIISITWPIFYHISDIFRVTSCEKHLQATQEWLWYPGRSCELLKYTYMYVWTMCSVVYEHFCVGNACSQPFGLGSSATTAMLIATDCYHYHYHHHTSLQTLATTPLLLLLLPPPLLPPSHQLYYYVHIRTTICGPCMDVWTVVCSVVYNHLCVGNTCIWAWFFCYYGYHLSPLLSLSLFGN
jgi:hypothetical protein